MTTPVLRFDSVRREYATGPVTVRALDGVDLTVEPGEFVAVMGPSGSGKSTLLALAGGLDSPTSGEVWVEGQPLSGRSAAERARLRRDHIGYVFQDLNLISALTAAENVALPRELAGVSARAALAEAHAALGEMQLGDLVDRYPDQLSGGQQQRVAIARALMGDRRLVLADEPTGSLDSETGEAVLAVLQTRVRDGAACVLVTHDERFAGLAHRVIRLADGRLTGKDRADRAKTAGTAS
ncbi:ABC transporter ATP-binding protein [Micromonospora sp. NPDC000089]|uniref:ABC transporter ATP-binding protein n=1 Tax=unclassified Micromonospora TaxID=2617518 RepID=UPI0036B4D609